MLALACLQPAATETTAMVAKTKAREWTDTRGKAEAEAAAADTAEETAAVESLMREITAEMETADAEPG